MIYCSVNIAGRLTTAAERHTLGELVAGEGASVVGCLHSLAGGVSQVSVVVHGVAVGHVVLGVGGRELEGHCRVVVFKKDVPMVVASSSFANDERANAAAARLPPPRPLTVPAHAMRHAVETCATRSAVTAPGLNV